MRFTPPRFTPQPVTRGGVALLVVVACQQPTQVTLVLTSDIPCKDLRGARILVGPLDKLDMSAESATTTSCDDSSGVTKLGTIVLLPSGDRSAAVGVEVVAAVRSKDLSACSTSSATDCIFARRSLRYIEHTPLTLPISLGNACVGRPCAADETCLDGVCKGARVDCSSGTCDESTLPNVDGGAPSSSSALVGTGWGGACAIGAKGLKCWGSWTAYGDGTTTPHLTPMAPAIGAGLSTQVTAGAGFACALLATGAVSCWGDGSQGVLGDGMAASNAPSPVTVKNVVGASQVVAGQLHACALVSTTVRCWGSRTFGQVDGAKGGVSLPAQVLLPPVAAVRAGSSATATCAILQTGGVSCWGSNDWGLHGDGVVQINLPSAPTTLSLTNVLDVAIGGNHACAVLANGSVQCWGNSDKAQTGMFANGALPFTPVTLTKKAIAVSCGYAHSCALLEDSTVECWGSNDSGQLGLGSSDTMAHAPTPVAGLSNVASLSCGDHSTCAMLANQTPMCWGAGPVVGNNTANGSPTPVAVLNFP